jgi:hypothetical protein
MNRHEWDGDIDRYHRRPSRLRFSLFALIAFVAAVNVLFAVVHQWGDDLGNRAMRRTEQLSELRWAPASDVLPLICAGACCLTGIVVAALVNRLGRMGYLAFCGVVCLSLLALVYAMNVEVRPLSDTTMQELKISQVLYAAAWPAAITLPACAFIGWYMSASKRGP